jgi:L-alanine-DL-glutamate epimerase-like enolase superfamily enzyme
MKIIDYDFNFEREKLLRPFKFKGGAFTEKWINVTAMRSDSGHEATGIGSTAILWSDPDVFSAHSETGGNLLMSTLTEYACALLAQKEFESPIDGITQIFPELHEYAKKITRNNNLRPTFTLNSLIAPDNTLWKLYAAEKNCESFDDLLEMDYPGVFNSKQDSLACLPLITYNITVEEIKEFVDKGVFFLKIKIGQGGTQEEMLQKDMERLTEIFKAVGNCETPHTDIGKTVFYLDANGRYETKELIEKLLEHCKQIGMLEQILILEEPFPEELEVDVSDLPVKIAADESLHSVNDVIHRIEMGYGAMTLKPAGKTMSMSLLMGKAALERGIPCYVADSACVPQLVDWNKNLAARLPLFPGLKCGFMESNGASFYSRWDELLEDHPCYGQNWLKPQQGMFLLDESFYHCSGGIFEKPGHYAELTQLT